MAQFTHDGFDLAYDELGPREWGRPVILIHGFSSNRNENWRRLGWYGAFERAQMRVAALDMRGHGESAKPHDANVYTSDALVGDIFALMDAIGADTADLVGYSMGARLALAATLKNPTRVKKLVVGGIGATLFDALPTENPIAAAMEADNPDTISEPILRSFRAFADEQGEDRLALAAFARGSRHEFARDALGTIAVPTLVVAGARDELAGSADVLAHTIPGARAITLPGCDHFSAISHGLFKASVIDFLNGVLE